MNNNIVSPAVSSDDLEMINRYTKKELSSDDVFVFSVVLCDNDIDRDGERFSDAALEKLSEMFVGVTGITDHDPKSKNQTARIFSAAAERVGGKKTSDGRDYIRLKAKAYMPRTTGNADFIRELEGGIKKEVSVGCSVKRKYCSICGKDTGVCSHVKGKSYGGIICCNVLDDPADAYEWSFVAVPAQREAGVIKNYKGDKNMDIEKRLSEGGEITLSAEEVQAITGELRSLRERAADGDTYRRRLKADITKAAVMALPELRKDILEVMVKNMNVIQLEELCSALTKRASAAVPLRPQLANDRQSEKNCVGNNDYKRI